ncbi:MAG TPA: asparagine synthase (glutamine-hydrolyzing) [Candidatus Manganitrophaceae bacterium]|nr:asparagine synthase (glutamine-hydrolyzing) [Candidatus Manganitrophaceae bacterium]
MCGIAGIYHPVHKRDQRSDSDIEKMTSLLARRGPDDCGYYIDDQVALGHRRLSVIDLSGGHQPIFNEDRSKCVIFNGEIFNYQDLKDELINKGYRFSTNSDTEAILRAYEEWGEGCPAKLRGMFAFCVWDAKGKSLFLARDRVGIKPLFYAEYDGKFVFASEMKSILSDPGFDRAIDREALASYFMFSYIPAPLTIYKNIKKLLPGHFLRIQNGRVAIHQYWDLYFEPNRRKKEEDFVRESMELLNESVKIRLMSEVPLGAFLSGGIDSGAVVALMSRETEGPVNTFTIGFGGDIGRFEDERKYAKLVADRYRTDHQEYEVSPDLEGLMGEIVESFDEPFADDAAIPTYFISEMARKKVTVALSGLGGDEAFGGYERYLGFQLSRLYEKIPGMIRENVVGKLIGALPERYAAGARVNHLKRFVRSSSADPGRRYLGYVSKISPRHEGSLFSESAGDYRAAFDAAKKRFLSHFDSPNAEDPLNKAFYCDIKTYLPEDILACTDRLSMRHSLEVRVPFLDHRLLEYCATIPPEIKMKNFQKKYLLKRGVSSLLPKEILRRKKQGFVGPMAQWLRTDLRRLTSEKLSEKSLERHGLFNANTVRDILAEHDRGKEDHGALIWSLLIFQTWHECYMEGGSTGPSRAASHPVSRLGLSL